MDAGLLRSALDILRSILVIQCDVGGIILLLKAAAVRALHDSEHCRNSIDEEDEDLAANLQLLSEDMASSRVMDTLHINAGLIMRHVL